MTRFCELANWRRGRWDRRCVSGHGSGERSVCWTLPSTPQFKQLSLDSVRRTTLSTSAVATSWVYTGRRLIDSETGQTPNSSLSRVRLRKLSFAPQFVLSRPRNPRHSCDTFGCIREFLHVISTWHRHCIIIHQCSCAERASSAAYILTLDPTLVWTLHLQWIDRMHFKMPFFFTPFFWKFSSLFVALENSWHFLCCNASSWILKRFTWPLFLAR